MRARQLKARTPDEVFFDREIRIPRRDPDQSFGYLFFDLVENGRAVGNNGIVYEGRIYRLVSLQKHLEYWGERVDVRVNPDDQRVAMIYDRRTGAYVCKALVDAQDATYDTRDEVTRHLIARVFSDGKHFLRMAKSYVDGSKERLPEYRRAKIEYLVGRAREIEAARKELRAEIKDAGVTVIGRYSALAREDKEEATELSATLVAEILDADEQAASIAMSTPLCVVSARVRTPKPAPKYQRREGGLTYAEIARKVGISLKSLLRYRQGVQPWPEGVKERFENYERLRTTPPSDATTLVSSDEPTPANPRRTWTEGKFSYANIAKALGMNLRMLDRCREGKRPWPAGTHEKFERMERQRSRKEVANVALRLS